MTQDNTVSGTCQVCNSSKSLSFLKKTRKGMICKECVSLDNRRKRIFKLFNITLEEYDKILLFQGGNCAICKNPPKNMKLAVDHDHKTGQIRGLLCSWCNKALGQFRDDIERVKILVDYFLNCPTTQALGKDVFGLKGRVTNKAKTRKRLNKK